MAALGHACEPRVDEAIRPLIVERLELRDEEVHRRTTVEDEHVPDILEQDPGDAATFEQTEDFSHET